MILSDNNVIAFHPIKIQICLAPQNDRQHPSFVKDTYVDCRCQKTRALIAVRLVVLIEPFRQI